MADLTLTSFGDKELRIVKLTLPEGEAVLPVYVVFYRADKQEFAKIAPAVGLYPEQAARLEYHFGSVNEWKKRDQFLIQRRHLSKLTETVSGITPSYYYRWPGKETPMPSTDRLKVNGEEIQPIPDDAEDFLEYVHKKRGIDRNVLRLAWTAVAKEAASWLLKKKKPINLGFVNIYAVPYRANWKEILLARFPNALWWFRHNVNKEGVFRSQLAQADFEHKLTDLTLMAIHNRDHYIHWTMEAVPSKDWEEDVAELERERKSGGNTAYVRHHEKTLADLLPRTLEVFTRYVEKTCRPFPQICSGAVDGSKKFLPYRGKADNLPQFGKSIRVSIVTNDGPAKLGNSREFQPIQPAVVPGMQNLPRLLPATDDVRKPVERREVDKPEDGSTGADWVHVPSASETKDTGESVLVKNGDERRHGLEGAIDI